MDIPLAVNGTLMRGLELNGNLVAAGARFVREATTAPQYRLWSIGDRHPAMIRVAEGGAAVAVEVWSVSPEGLATILLKEPPGLSIGKVRLEDDDPTRALEVPQPRRRAPEAGPDDGGHARPGRATAGTRGRAGRRAEAVATATKPGATARLVRV